MIRVKLTEAMRFRGEVLWPGTIIDLPKRVAVDMVKDRHAVIIPRTPERPESTLAKGERRGY